MFGGSKLQAQVKAVQVGSLQKWGASTASPSSPAAAVPSLALSADDQSSGFAAGVREASAGGDAAEHRLGISRRGRKGLGRAGSVSGAASAMSSRCGVCVWSFFI